MNKIPKMKFKIRNKLKRPKKIKNPKPQKLADGASYWLCSPSNEMEKDLFPKAPHGSKISKRKIMTI